MPHGSSASLACMWLPTLSFLPPLVCAGEQQGVSRGCGAHAAGVQGGGGAPARPSHGTQRARWVEHAEWGALFSSKCVEAVSGITAASCRHACTCQPLGVRPVPLAAAGMRFRCISCDTALHPFVFAAAPGAGAGAAPAPAHTADLRYTQLPVASPARNASQPWTAAGTLGAEPAAVGLAAVGQPAGEHSRLSAVGSPAGEVPAVQPPSPRGGRQSTRAASRLGSPARWATSRWRECCAVRCVCCAALCCAVLFG